MVAARIIVNPDWFFFFGMKRKLLFFGLFVARKKKHFSKNCQKACHHTAQRPDIAYVHVLHITHYAPITYMKYLHCIHGLLIS